MHGVLPPATVHQRIVTRLGTLISNYLRGKTPEVFMGLSVWFDDHGFIVPDLIVVCDKEKIQENGCVGAPDWVIEIVEPATTLEDKGLKHRLYRDLGVREYWIIDPSCSLVEIYRMDEGMYVESEAYRGNQVVPVSIFNGLEISLSDIL